jgi:Polyketide cyclase / dehydrase and lipid transport
VLEAAQTTPGPPGVGARGRDRRRFLGRTTETEYKVTAYDPPRVFGVRSLSGPVPVRASYTVAPGSGGTRVESVADFDVRGPMRLLAPLLGRMIQRQHERDLQRLKELLEAEPPS